MSRIDELLSRLAPDGVQHRTLQEVGSFVRGGGPQKKDFSDEGVGCIHYGQIYTHYGIHASTTLSHVSPEVAARSRKAQPGDVIIAVTGENDTDLARAVAWLGDAPVAVSNHTLIYTSSLDPKYVSYFLRSSQFSEQKRTRIFGTKVRSISAQQFGTIRIPVPPVEVQREIVRILDHFTELEARRLQFLHVRSTVFADVDSHVEPLGAIARNLDGRRRPVTKAARVPGPIPYYGASGVVDYVHDFIFDGEYLLVSEDGANLLARSSPIAFSVTGKSWINNHAHVLELESSTQRRFVEFYLNSIDLTPFVSGESQPKLNQANLNRIPIPTPPAGVQERVVEVLSRLDALLNDLSVGLPAELSARRRQYEYYRDKLLTFEEKR